ncbi:MAG: hypothetical protein M3N13_01995 [Candidatus Eremiobacteraeota bacterium]|nr:hypothetical protein [Candidatus Eremiobacteraeota bacterium]
MNRTNCFSAAAIAAISLNAIAAAAAPRTVGQTFVYDVTVATKMTSGVPSAVPAFARAQYEAQQAMAAKGSTSTYTFTVDRVESDGSSHLQGAETGSRFPAAALALAPYLNTFMATLSPDGSIVPIFDPNMAPSTTRDNKFHTTLPTEASAQNMNAEQVHMTEFNRFAQGCAKRGHFTIGDVWRVRAKDSSGMATLYEFSVSALDDVSGHQYPHVSMSTSSTGTTGSQKITSDGHYDANAGIVVDFHEQTAFNNTYPGGETSGTTSTDYRLRPQ